MILYLVRPASEHGKPFDFTRTNDIFSKREDAEERLKASRTHDPSFLIERCECPLVYSDDLELHPQCNLEIQNRFCFWHDVTDYFHKAFHRIILDKDPLTESEKRRIREHAERYFSNLDSILRNGTTAVRVPGYAADAYYLSVLLKEFKKAES
jgi:hypothetical protein